jgi:hypothetical protein
MRLLSRIGLPFALLVFAAAAAEASEPTPTAGSFPKTAASERQRDLAITVSPIHLLFPILEVTSEYRLADNLGGALIGGFGRVDRAWWALEAGGQLRWYALGSFRHGMQVGGELIYLHVTTQDAADTGIAASAAGLSVGPYRAVPDLGSGRPGHRRRPRRDC